MQSVLSVLYLGYDDGAFGIGTSLEPHRTAGAVKIFELREAGANRVMLDTRGLFDGPRVTPEEIETWDRKPRLPVRAVATGAEPVVRYVGQTDADANPTYWEPWVDRVVRWLDIGLSPLVFLHTPDNAVSPELARRFHDMVRRRVPDLEVLSSPEPISTRSGWLIRR